MPPVTLTSLIHPRSWYAWPILGLLLLLGRLPVRLLSVLGAALGIAASWLPTPNKRFAARNLELCFPALSEAERKILLRRHFAQSGFAALCLGIAWFGSPRRIRKLVSLRDMRHITDAQAAGKNVILLAPHFIALDIGGARLAIEHDQRYIAMYRKSRDPFLEYLFHRRSRFGCILVERMEGLKSIIKALRDGRVFYYLPDQDMGARASVFVPFFGIPAATVTVMSRIAAATNAVVIPCITRMSSSGLGFETRLYPPLERFPGDDATEDAARMNREIERWVRESPEQYMWTYRRFKTRPNHEPSLYS